MKPQHILSGLLAAAVVGAPPLVFAAAQTHEAPRAHSTMERGPSIAMSAHHGPDAASSMPRIAPTRVITVTGDEDWDALTGFGKSSPFVAMMNLMMVGGSGFEHMRMPAVKPGDHTMDRPTADPSDPMGFMNSHLGIRDRMVNGAPSVGGESAPPPGLQGVRLPEPPPVHHPVPPVEVEPPAPPVATTPTTSAPPVTAAPAAPKPAGLALTATIATPKVGKNVMDIRLAAADGAPIPGAEITAEVNMTSMDMGVRHPPVKEVAPGRYQVTVAFGMRGPWRVVLRAVPPSGLPVNREFDYRVK